MKKETAKKLQDKFDALTHFSGEREISNEIRISIFGFIEGYISAILEK